MVLANPAPKTSASLEEEGSLYFFLFIIAFIALLGMIFYPKQFAALVGQTIGSMFSPAVAVAEGIITFITNLVSAAWNHVTGAITGAGSYLYNNTIGRL